MIPQIQRCMAREILDSRGNPTVEAEVVLSNGVKGTASVPSGASTGMYEAYEKRDNNSTRYGGKGVLHAVNNINDIISPTLAGEYACEQSKIDNILISLDKTDNKSEIGANAMLAVSLAVANASAVFYHMPLYRYLGGINAKRIPLPMFNIMNGGAHAANNIDIQEFMIIPIGFDNFYESLRVGSEIYHTLGKILKENGYQTSVGDEGGYAPNLDSDENALELICEAITQSGYTKDDIKIALDAAASEWHSNDSDIYYLPKRKKALSRQELITYFKSLCDKYPIISIEDCLGENDFDGWTEITQLFEDKILLVGDDLFVTNERRLSHGIITGAANTILIKPNQIGTLTETLNVIRKASENGYRFILSHRSGETADTTIADIAVAVNAPFIKSGAPCRSERVEKYNRLLKIEEDLGGTAVYGLRKQTNYI